MKYVSLFFVFNLQKDLVKSFLSFTGQSLPLRNLHHHAPSLSILFVCSSFSRSIFSLLSLRLTHLPFFS